jgi:predicted NBD/HSP70 family sugar kinase
VIFYLFLNGWSHSEIADLLTQYGRKTKLGNQEWNPTSIAGIIENERHCGYVIARKTYTPNFKDHKSVKNTGQRNKYIDPKDHDPIVSKDVFDAAMAGDALAKEIFDFTGRIMGQAFADFVAFSAPEAIILFGGLANAGDLLMKPIVKAMEENLLQIWKGKIKVLPSGLASGDAAVLGASALGWKAKNEN